MEGKRVTSAPAAAKRSIKAVWIAAAAAVALTAVAVAGVCAHANSYEDIFPGVSAAGVSLGGMDREEAKSALEEALPSYFEKTAVQIGLDGTKLAEYSLSQLGVRPLVDEMVESAYGVGRAGTWAGKSVSFIKGCLGGRTDIPLSAQSSGDAGFVAREIAAQVETAPVNESYELTREGLYITKHLDGRSVDSAALTARIEQAVQERSGGAAGEAEWIECPVAEVPATQLDIDALAAELSTEPSPARYDVAQGKVVDGEVGVSIDPEAVRFTLDAAAGGETVKVPAEVTYPEMTAQELEAVLFRDMLGTYTTNVSGSSARKGNVRLAGEAVNGTVLNDQDIFDYNTVVGKRTAERGFGAAGTYVNGQTVNTIGGGICQVSSTIYMTALLSNLEIVERSNHRFYPGYIPKGMDATVSWGGPEFKFKNNTGYPIRMDVSYKNSKITVTFYGTKTDDTYVKMTNEVLSTTGYETVYQETEDLPYGTQKEKQNGYTGYVVKTYRNIYDGSGKLISSNLEAKSTYSNRDRIILVGTAGKPADPALDVPAGGTGTVPDTSGPDTGASDPDSGAALPDDGGEPALPTLSTEPETPPETTEPEPEPAATEDASGGGDAGSGDIPGWLLT